MPESIFSGFISASGANELSLLCSVEDCVTAIGVPSEGEEVDYIGIHAFTLQECRLNDSRLPASTTTAPPRADECNSLLGRCQLDVDPGNRSRVNESLHPAILRREYTIKYTRQTGEQIIHKLKSAEQLIVQGKTVADVCRVIEVMQPTDHCWRQQYGGIQAEEGRRLTQLEKENARPKKLLAEAELEEPLLKDLAEGNV